MSPNQKAAKAPSRERKIVLVGGGSGGHIVPLLSLARALRTQSPDSELIYIGVKGDKFNGLGKRLTIFNEIYYVSAGKLRRYQGQSLIASLLDIKSMALNLRDFFKVGYGYIQARRLLRSLNPSVVVSKGGYGAVPVGLAAHSLKVPLITHDSDAVPGLANRLIGRWAAIHATGQPGVDYSNFYPASSIHYVGIPIDERLKPSTDERQVEYKKKLGLPKDSFAVLVTGGGLGAKALNDKTISIARTFLEDSQNYILHFCGAKHFHATESAYKASLSEHQLKQVKLVSFSPDFYIYSGAADVVVARAGASTLAELGAQHKACIIVPAGFLSSGHQLGNVAELKKHHAIVTVDNSITPQNLLSKIIELKQNPTLRQELGQKLGSMTKTDGASEFAKLILNCANDI